MWLQTVKAAGFDAYLRWRALQELQVAEKGSETYVTPYLGVGIPTTAVERAAVESDSTRPSGIVSLDFVRITALAIGKVNISEELRANGNLVETWLAVGKPAGNLELKHNA